MDDYKKSVWLVTSLPCKHMAYGSEVPKQLGPD